MSDLAIRAEDIGIRFHIRRHKATLNGRLARFIKGNEKPDEFWAFRNINFEVPRGSVFGIIGPNGAGKSTMLRTIARIYHPDEGRLWVRGKISNLISLGAGFQKSLSGLENITYNAMLLGLSRQEIDKVRDQIIDFADLGSFIEAPVRTYSSGMKARLGFSVAVHVDPEILVVDEVLVVGDAAFRKKCQEKIRDLFSSGATIIMVQHNMDAILEMCDRVMWLEGGKAQMIGDPLQVVNGYLESRGIKGMDPSLSEEKRLALAARRTQKLLTREAMREAKQRGFANREDDD